MKYFKRVVAIILSLSMLFLCACTKEEKKTGLEITRTVNKIDDNYRTFYQIFVCSFYDGNGDGTGDLQGIIDKLDYLNDGNDETVNDLGIDGIWLSPIMPSPTYHGYDVTDYCAVNEKYGTIKDFDNLVRKCNDREINVIVDLPINHTGSGHEWFLTAYQYIVDTVKAGGTPNKDDCPYFDYYNFADSKVSGTYYPVGSSGWYYEGQFTSGMPDLNLESELLRAEIEKVVDFWIEHGVAGFRLDAVGEYYSGNTKRSVDALTWFCDYVKSVKEDAYLVGECWSGMLTYTSFYESGIDSLFNFDFAGAEGIVTKTASLKMKGFGAKDYLDKCEQIQSMIASKNANGIDAPFFTNHDMNRAASYFKDEEALNELKMAAGLNLCMSGTAFIYYGEEIGMVGNTNDPDRRSPMYWTNEDSFAGKCAKPEGCTTAFSDMLYPSVKEQLQDEDSLLSYYRNLIAIRNEFPEIARGQVTKVASASDMAVGTMIKSWNDSEIMIVFNTSNEVKTVDFTDVTLNGKPVSECAIADYVVNRKEKENEIKFADGSLEIPAFCFVIIK